MEDFRQRLEHFQEIVQVIFQLVEVLAEKVHKMEPGAVIHAFDLQVLLEEKSLVGVKMCHKGCIRFNLVFKMEPECWLLKKQIWCANLLLAFNNWNKGDLNGA